MLNRQHWYGIFDQEISQNIDLNNVQNNIVRNLTKRLTLVISNIEDGMRFWKKKLKIYGMQPFKADRVLCLIALK